MFESTSRTTPCWKGDGWRSGGIRTLDTVLPYTHFPGERLRPLGHRSAYRWKGVPLGIDVQGARLPGVAALPSAGHDPCRTPRGRASRRRDPGDRAGDARRAAVAVPESLGEILLFVEPVRRRRDCAPGRSAPSDATERPLRGRAAQPPKRRATRPRCPSGSPSTAGRSSPNGRRPESASSSSSRTSSSTRSAIISDFPTTTCMRSRTAPSDAAAALRERHVAPRRAAAVRQASISSSAPARRLQVTGPNGSGKSSLIRLAAGLLQAEPAASSARRLRWLTTMSRSTASCS